jgi:hypothetical protein
VFNVFLHNILARPLTQLGDGDGEREGVEEGDAGDGEEWRSPNLSIKGHILV